MAFLLCTQEIKLLRHLGGHQNVIWILDIMVSPNRRDFVCVAGGGVRWEGKVGQLLDL